MSRSARAGGTPPGVGPTRVNGPLYPVPKAGRQWDQVKGAKVRLVRRTATYNMLGMGVEDAHSVARLEQRAASGPSTPIARWYIVSR